MSEFLDALAAEALEAENSLTGVVAVPHKRKVLFSGEEAQKEVEALRQENAALKEQLETQRGITGRYAQELRDCGLECDRQQEAKWKAEEQLKAAQEERGRISRFGQSAFQEIADQLADSERENRRLEWELKAAQEQSAAHRHGVEIHHREWRNCERECESLRKQIEAARQAGGAWVRVEERLPDNEREVEAVLNCGKGPIRQRGR